MFARVDGAGGTFLAGDYYRSMDLEWKDISVPLDEGIVTWPGDSQFHRESVSDIATNGVQISDLRMSCHTGTHVDSPAHYIEDGATVDEMAADVMIGPCVVVEIAGVERVGAAELEHAGIKESERLLLKTSNSERQLLQARDFHDDYCFLTPDGAAFLAEHHIRCVGIDYLSIGGMDDGEDTHRILLSSGVWIIEGLDLWGIDAGEYELACLPLKLVGADGAPARALIRRREPEEGEMDFIEDAVEWATKTG